MEWMILGYCRAQDQARTVVLEQEDGRWFCDCDYPGCTFSGNCPLANQMQKIQEEHP